MSYIKDLILKRIVESIEQQYKSTKTSLNQVPAGDKKAIAAGLIKPNSKNIATGGGRFDTAKDHVESSVEGAKMHVHDKFNRSEDHNKEVEKQTEGTCDYTSSHNVGNVIDSDVALHDHIKFGKSRMKKGGVYHFTAYEGDRSGKPTVTKGGESYQRNQPIEHYRQHLEKVFNKNTHTVEKKAGGFVVMEK